MDNKVVSVTTAALAFAECSDPRVLHFEAVQAQ